MNIAQKTARVKQISSQMGFDYCGIARAEKLDDDAQRLEQWLNKNYHGTMAYMANHFDLRIDPALLVPGAKSVITILYNYYPHEQQHADAPQIAKYAYGNDYHEAIRARLNEFLLLLRENFGEIDGRGFVDSAPVLERSWAQRSGLGWIGKNGNLINKSTGSFFFIATLITDLDLVPDDPFQKDFCGTCTRCIDACPTGAIVENRVVDANRCISYLTIELKNEAIPDEFSGKMNNWMFGCDICQDVCPWNRFSRPHHHPELAPSHKLLNLTTSDWESLEEDTFKLLAKHSPLKRPKWKGIKRNLLFLKGSGSHS
ncbi:MAG: tRNA epoxyqueuosine(34) reductase QueG [Edaphocola sp.]